MGLLFFNSYTDVYFMAFKSLINSLKNYPLTHLPTLALGIGTVVFWLELYFIRLPFGNTSVLAWGLFTLLILAIIFSRSWTLKSEYWQGFFIEKSLVLKVVFALGFLLGLIYLGVGLYASLLPPHLTQENDALMYHLTLPRQHLLRHSFAHIPWSVPDLFLLPLDYALSPFELCTTLPNKFIQFIFFVASLGCVFRLVYIYSANSSSRVWVVVGAVMACHAVAIQVGLAMLDLVMLYCFLAFIHSLFLSRWALAAVEFAFFFWSKSFIPFQISVIGVILGIILWIALKRAFHLFEIPTITEKARRTLITTFIVVSLGVALPHLIKSYYYTGTPFYPFGVGVLTPLVKSTPDHWQAILQRAADCMNEKNVYGHGRSWAAFIKHFWLIAVPEKGVNNAFDYPVGLMYILVLLPFGGHVVNSLKSKRMPVLSLIVILFWLTWWFGSQQSRFLLVPVSLMIILTISSLPRLSRVLVILVVLLLGVETISLINAHRHDWGKPYLLLLRDQDKEILKLKPTGLKSEVIFNFPDVAYARFPVVVNQNNSFYVLSH